MRLYPNEDFNKDKIELKETLKGVNFRETFCTAEFRAFACFLIKVTIPTYMEYLAFEVITIFCGIIGNTDLISGWVAFGSICGLNFFLGMGFANAIRTFVGIEIGRGNLKIAKKFASWGLICNIVCMYIPGICLIVFSRDISYFFTDVESSAIIIDR